jgi:hypothetical protein
MTSPSDSTGPFVLFRLEATGRPAIWNIYPTIPDAEAGRSTIHSSFFGPPETYEVIPLADYLERQRAFHLGGTLEELPAEDWDSKCDILPPLHAERLGELERFCWTEFQEASYTRQFARFEGRVFTRFVDADDRSTWITEAMIRDHLYQGPGSPAAHLSAAALGGAWV